MPPSSRSKDFSELYWKSSKELYSEKFYEAMDMDSPDLHKYDSKCNDIQTKNHRDQMIPICKKYLRFLDTSKAWINLFSAYDVSLLLNYWLYEKLIGIYGDDKSNYITYGFVDLQMVWGYFDGSREKEPYYQKCKPDPSKVYQEDWENTKKLYDYYVDYDILFRSASTIDKFCKEYYKKIKEYFTLYEYFQGKCPTKEYICPDFFHKFKKEKPEYKLEYLPCYREMEQAIALEAKAKGGPSQHHADSERGPGALGDDSRSSGRELGTLDTELSPESSDIKTKVTNSVLGAAPVLLTATALYRYTPFGSWIRKFRGGNANTVGAIDVVPNYMQETGDIFSDNDANYISYQPM